MANVIDKEKLLLALKGKYRAKSTKPAWCQELSEAYSRKVTEICVDGLQPITIPVPKKVC